jgi:hypothetical protein
LQVRLPNGGQTARQERWEFEDPLGIASSVAPIRIQQLAQTGVDDNGLERDNKRLSSCGAKII